jgi:hypothetical protein
MPRLLRRYYGCGDLHFITCSCYRRQPFLVTAGRRDLDLTVLEQVRRPRHILVAAGTAHANTACAWTDEGVRSYMADASVPRWPFLGATERAWKTQGPSTTLRSGGDETDFYRMFPYTILGAWAPLPLDYSGERILCWLWCLPPLSQKARQGWGTSGWVLQAKTGKWWGRLLALRWSSRSGCRSRTPNRWRFPPLLSPVVIHRRQKSFANVRDPGAPKVCFATGENRNRKISLKVGHPPF